MLQLSAGATGGAAPDPAELLVVGEGCGVAGRRQLFGLHILGSHLYVGAVLDPWDIALWLGHEAVSTHRASDFPTGGR